MGEEARYRWFDLCETEDVMVDDIAIIIIEISTTSPMTNIEHPNHDRKFIRFKTMAYESDSGWNPNFKNARGTVIYEEDEEEKD